MIFVDFLKGSAIEGLKRPLKKWKMLVAQSCLTLCDPMDWSPPGSSVHGIFQARVLEWGAIAFSCILLNPYTPCNSTTVMHQACHFWVTIMWPLTLHWDICTGWWRGWDSPWHQRIQASVLTSPARWLCLPSFSAFQLQPSLVRDHDHN